MSQLLIGFKEILLVLIAGYLLFSLSSILFPIALILVVALFLFQGFKFFKRK